jgi:hypothetical protein
MRHRLCSSGVTAHCWTSPYTGDKTWPTLLVQKKKLRFCPYVDRVRRNEKGQVAHQPQPLSFSVALSRSGLSEQKELCEANLTDLIGKFTTHLLECRRQREFP